MSLDENGFQLERFEDISPELKQDLRDDLDPNLDTSSSSVAGIITDILSAAIANNYALGQSIYDSGYIDTAEGISLDRLVELIGVSRIGASPTNGPIHLTGTLTTVVGAGTTFSNPETAEQYLLDSAVTLTNTNCVKIVISPIVPTTDGQPYVVNIAGSFSHTLESLSNPTASDVVTDFETELTLLSDGSYTVVADTTTGSESITITITNPQSPVSITYNNWSNSSVTGLGNVTGVTTGAISAPINTITNIVTPVNGLNSVTNPIDLEEGRAIETDEELRQRAKESTRIAGTATVPAITASLNNTIGVTRAAVIENTTFITDGDGRPPKSYECIVSGGADQDIGNTIWETKPAGIAVVGDTEVDIVDSEGNTHKVYFSRPIDKYVWVNVTYSLYTEETAPVDAEAGIKQSIVNAGDALDVGEDIIVDRFKGPIYTDVSGIGPLTIEMTITDLPTDTPTGFVETQIAISQEQISNFLADRITVTQV